MSRSSASSWCDVALDAPAVDLELGLARAPAGADATGLLGEPGPAPPQAGQAVAELGQLDLGLALVAVGVLGEDVEDHRGAVDRRAPEQLLQVELLGRGQLVVEDHRVAVGLQGDARAAPRPCPCRCSTSGSGAARRWTTRAAVSAPAVSTSELELVEATPRCPRAVAGGVVTPTRTIFSRKDAVDQGHGYSTRGHGHDRTGQRRPTSPERRRRAIAARACARSTSVAAPGPSRGPPRPRRRPRCRRPGYARHPARRRPGRASSPARPGSSRR